MATKVEVGEYAGLWTYVYFGYSNKAREAGVVVGYPDAHYSFRFRDVQHFIPNYLGLYVGADGLQPSWSGFAKHVNLILGEAAFIHVQAENILEIAPKYDAHKGFEHYSWKEEDNELVYDSPVQEGEKK